MDVLPHDVFIECGEGQGTLYTSLSEAREYE